MDSYQDRQLELIKKIEESFKEGKAPSTIVEPVSNYVNDNRICFTSVVFVPNNLIPKIIEHIINPLRKVNPMQYFYVRGSFHITINNIRTIANPPLFNNEDIEKAREVFKRIIPKYEPFTFELKRLFELPTSLAISAFSDEALGNLALELRAKLKQARIPDNKTYAAEDIIIGSTTISRFTDTPNPAFKEKVKELKEIEIGSFEARKVFLITTNSVCHPTKTKIIEEYLLS